MPLGRVWTAVTLALLAAYVALAAIHLTVTPVATDSTTNFINAPDEAAHLMYVRAIAESGRPPVRGDERFPTYEWHQPPLYYALASPLYGSGPHAVRWLSVAIGLLSLAALFRAARLFLPDDPAASVLALGLAALLPMRHAITAAASNDPLIELAFSLTALLLITLFRDGITLRRATILGVLLAAALMTKANGLLLVPISLAGLALARRGGERIGAAMSAGAVALGISVTLTAGWYARNYRLYGELTPARSFVREFEGTRRASEFLAGNGFRIDAWSGEILSRGTLSRPEYLALVANWTARTFVAAYTPPGRAATLGIPFFLPAVFYLPYWALAVTALAGLARLHFRRKQELSPVQTAAVYLLFAVAGLVTAAFAGFIWTYFQAQGRYLYPALLPFALLSAVGIRSVTPAPRRHVVYAGILALLGLLACAFLLIAILPAYGS